MLRTYSAASAAGGVAPGWGIGAIQEAPLGRRDGGELVPHEPGVSARGVAVAGEVHLPAQRVGIAERVLGHQLGMAVDHGERPLQGQEQGLVVPACEGYGMAHPRPFPVARIDELEGGVGHGRAAHRAPVAKEVPALEGAGA